MCFSAQASFAASAFLLVTSLLSRSKVKSPSHMMFATIPLLFSLQQCVEGILWIILPYKNYYLLQTIMTYTFLFFALVIWPTWIPWSLFLIETKQTQKKILSYFSYVGIFLSTYLLHNLLNKSAWAQIRECHIFYDYIPTTLPIKYEYMVALYCIPTIFSFFIISNNLFKFLGSILLVSVIITGIFWKLYFTSVWCFFAAIISIAIFFTIINIDA